MELVFIGKSIGELDLNDISKSPKYRVKDWITASDRNDWTLSTDIFYDRIESRYLKPVRHIARDDEIGEFSGFAILVIDCLIIETLNQFYNGLDQTKGKHWKAFWYVFKNSPHFKESFTAKKAEIFYGHFHCGILHQAQTKSNSVVRICRVKMIEEVNPEKISDGLIVDSGLFHSALEKEITDYKKKLISGEPEHNIFRENFIRKMNYICNLK